MPTRIAILVMTILVASIAWGQAQAPSGSQPSMAGMDMPGHEMSPIKGAPAGAKEKEADSEAGAPVMGSMEGQMDMGPHMKMTALRPQKPGDSERVRQIVASARVVAEKYLDFHTALNDGYKIFLPDFPQKIYHFTNYNYGGGLPVQSGASHIPAL